MPYVCYDIKGIQRFIFSVPKLKCIVGGSSSIAQFDSDASQIPDDLTAQLIYTGGGKGAFFAESLEAIDRLKASLIQRAHSKGLDIQFGVDDQLRVAATSADEFYPFCPESLEGEPCALSGLYPAAAGKVSVPIRQRMDEGRRDRFGQSILEALESRLPQQLSGQKVEFFRNVSPDVSELDEPDPLLRSEEHRHALAAQYALGNRNRWAVIAMDGNDVGAQFSAFEQQSPKPSVAEFRTWLKEMSQQMKVCTFNAVLEGLLAVIFDWIKDVDLEECQYQDHQGDWVTVLPVRPLILGGDDVVLLCHPAHAFHFVQTVAQTFASESSRVALDYKMGQLWPGSGNELSISGGVLFTKVSLPLHSAIPYAEDLLKNAKNAYRQGATEGAVRQPTPAAIDFEVVTDSLLDSPTERRRRDLVFADPDLNQAIRALTRRPYRIDQRGSEDSNSMASESIAENSCEGGQGAVRKHDSFADLADLTAALEQIPASVRSQLIPCFRRPWSERTEFLASLSKRYNKFVKLFWEQAVDDQNVKHGKGWLAMPGESERDRECGLADALILLEEHGRHSQETV